MRADTSFWLAGAQQASQHPPLGGDTESEVVVIGGGLTGVLTTWLLGSQGVRVLLLDAGRAGAGVTGHSTAKVTALHGAIYHRLLRRHGVEVARAYATAQIRGLELICDLAGDLGIDCGLRRLPAYTYATTASEIPTVHQEAEAALQVGLPASVVTETPLPFRVSAAVRLGEQAQFDPWRFVRGVLDRAAELPTVTVCEDTCVSAMSEREGLRVRTTSGHLISTGDVVVATHYPIFNRALLFTRLSVRRAFALAVAWDSHPLDGMYYGLERAAPSVRAADGHLVVTANRFVPGAPSDQLTELETLTRRRFPAAGSVHSRWATQDMFSADGIPLVGRMLPWRGDVHVATGFAGWGLTNGAAAALTIAGRILGTPTEWAATFDPLRWSPTASLPAALKEQLRIGREFVIGNLFGGGRLVGQGMTDVELPPGTGRLVSRHGTKYAVFRDDDGTYNILNARCPHLGCIVSFNAAERTWQCPCHGSEFAADGSVLHGPATQGLQPTEMPPP